MQSDSTISKVAPYLQDILVKVKYVPMDAAASFVESLYNTAYEIDSYGVMPEEGEVLDSYGYYNPINYKGDGSFQFLHDADYNMRSYNDYYSRWRGQTGVRLIFNVGTKGRFFPCTFFVINK